MSAYADRAVAGELARLRGASPGSAFAGAGRNNSLFVASANLGSLVAGGALDHGYVQRLLLEEALAVGLERDEAESTIKSGMKKGALKPRKPEERPSSRRREHHPLPPSEPSPPQEPERTVSFFDDAVTRFRAKLRRITAADPIGRYLISRGASLPHPEGDLLWHPCAKHPTGNYFPCMVGIVTSIVTNEPMTLHRTFIKPDGTGKADVRPARLYWKGFPKAGGRIRLWPDDEVTMGLAIAEGIETSLALARGFGLAWACLDSGNVGNFPVLDGIDALTIAVDHDPAGIKAARQCAKRWTASGKEVRLVKAEAEGADFADIAAGAAS